jgi:hypothetical protein
MRLDFPCPPALLPRSHHADEMIHRRRVKAMIPRHQILESRRKVGDRHRPMTRQGALDVERHRQMTLPCSISAHAGGSSQDLRDKPRQVGRLTRTSDDRCRVGFLESSFLFDVGDRIARIGVASVLADASRRSQSGYVPKWGRKRKQETHLGSCHTYHTPARRPLLPFPGISPNCTRRCTQKTVPTLPTHQTRFQRRNAQQVRSRGIRSI